jgi:probable F420-dependent oxidoreductase
MISKFGLSLRNFVGPKETPDVSEILAYAERAEELGYESLWAFDHLLLGHDPVFPILDSLSILTAVASRTENINLGTGILVLPLRNPVWAAKEMASLDQISKGRFILGAGSGWYKREFDAAGVSFEDRGRIFERNLDIILQLWEGKHVNLEVDNFNLRQAVQEPRPFRQPHPPVLIGGYVDKVLRRVARVSDGWITYAYTPDGFTKSWNKIKKYAVEYGRDPSSLTATNQVAINIGPPKEESGPAIRNWLVTEWDFAAWSDSTVEHAVSGTVDECVEQLKGYIATELDRIIFIPYRYQPEQVELIAKELIPRLNTETIKN